MQEAKAAQDKGFAWEFLANCLGRARGSARGSGAMSLDSLVPGLRPAHQRLTLGTLPCPGRLPARLVASTLDVSFIIMPRPPRDDAEPKKKMGHVPFWESGQRPRGHAVSRSSFRPCSGEP